MPAVFNVVLSSSDNACNCSAWARLLASLTRSARRVSFSEILAGVPEEDLHVDCFLITSWIIKARSSPPGTGLSGNRPCSYLFRTFARRRPAPGSSRGESTPPSDTSGLHNPNRSPERDRIPLHERCERGSDGAGDRSDNVLRLALEGSADRADLKCTLNSPFQALPDRNVEGQVARLHHDL